jgi:hypothetical protein
LPVRRVTASFTLSQAAPIWRTKGNWSGARRATSKRVGIELLDRREVGGLGQPGAELLELGRHLSDHGGDVDMHGPH